MSVLSRFLIALLGVACLTTGPARAETSRKGRSGTAFVVHKDGLLVTCAHVVRGATEIEVMLGNKALAAQVVAQDQIRDLALLRVKEKRLKPLVLRANPGLVGQEVRAFGYPLTNSLGESMKVTRGSFSGYGAGDVPPLIIDVPINAGNSGGPLVNERGEVIGVISAKIAAPGVTNVGFAVAMPDLQAMLENARKEFRFEKSKKEGKPLSGTELVDKVAPSVGLVLAWSDGNLPDPPRRTEKKRPEKVGDDNPGPAPPAPQKDAAEGKAAWELTNGTEKEITITLDGPEKHHIVLASGKTKVILVEPGDYRVTIPFADGMPPFKKTYSLRADERRMTKFAFAE